MAANSDPLTPSILERYHSLLAVTSAIAVCDTIPLLAHALAGNLGTCTESEVVAILLFDAERDTMVIHVVHLGRGEYQRHDDGYPVRDFPSSVVFRTQKPVTVSDWENEDRWPRMKEVVMGRYACRSTAQVPLTSARRALGVMTFMSKKPDAYDPAEVEFLAKVAQQVAVAVESILSKEQSVHLQLEICRQRDRLQLLLDIVDVTVTHLDMTQMFVACSRRMRPELDHGLGLLVLYDPQRREMILAARDADGVPGTLEPGAVVPLENSLTGRAVLERKTILYSHDELARLENPATRLAVKAGIRTLCAVPLIVGENVLGAMVLGSVRDNAFNASTVSLINDVAGQLAIAVANALAFRQLSELRDKLAQEKHYLEDEVKTQLGFDDIIGQSQAIRTVLDQVRLVADTSATVLITGETGTGKELIARAIHRLGNRRDRTLIKMNCAAIPAALLESELFGHERGAFTGAVAQRIGRFELANGGTLFLDEVGDLPLELQPKLLRALQEQEFERLGGSRTLKVDVRIIAATNRDLQAMVAARQFRSDLFYRLSIFPLHIPPLRQRKDDIPLLVSHFTKRAARQLGRKIETIRPEAMQAMIEYPWPGNLRELQNFVERGVILSRGSILELPLRELAEALPQSPPTATISDDIENVQREHILKVLQQRNWIIGGKSGAAAHLGMKRTTLLSRMQKLGIERPA